jgi:hypothetical protein
VVDTASVGVRVFPHRIAGVALVAATVALALPQAAAATVYDKQMYNELVADGSTAEQARCVSALEGAHVSLERYVDGYFVSVILNDSAIAPNTNPQQTDEAGNYSWEVGDGDYRVSVTKAGYWRSFSGIVSGPGAVVSEDVALERRPGTPPPTPRDDCVTEPEPVPEPQPEPEPKPDHDPKSSDDDSDAQGTCLLRPVNARVRGTTVRQVVFSLDGRVIKRVRRPDEDGVFGVTVERTTLPRGKHVLRAKVYFVRRAHRDPELLRLAIRRCPERVSSDVVKASPRTGCGRHSFFAWVRAHRVRKVFFTLDGRRIGRDSVADWRGRYGVMVNPSHLSKGRHVVAAHIEFLRDSGLKDRTLRLRFRKCV